MFVSGLYNILVHCCKIPSKQLLLVLGRDYSHRNKILLENSAPNLKTIVCQPSVAKHAHYNALWVIRLNQIVTT